IDGDVLLGTIAALESRAKHPLASAIVKKAGQQSHLRKIEEFSALPGRGVTGRVDGVAYFVGNRKLFEEKMNEPLSAETIGKIKQLQNQGKTVMIAGDESNVIALIAVADEVRVSSKDVIERLHLLGIEKTILLTGDNGATAKFIGREVRVSDIQAELLPEDKLKFIKKLQVEYGNVAMVGDGVNDAPALAAATVGIAMGGAGADTALETADIALMNDDLTKLPFTVKLSRKTLQIIKQNITFSLVIKLLALLLVIPGWLTLWIAIFADMGTTLLVTLNGLRLLKVKDDGKIVGK
ncbi:MAG: HAD-IC family P-type ATPase, partial [Bacillota bacterium]|nr:HAD-IC family P-type ATPase [Bacillota bacterium]